MAVAAHQRAGLPWVLGEVAHEVVPGLVGNGQDALVAALAVADDELALLVVDVAELHRGDLTAPEAELAGEADHEPGPHVGAVPEAGGDLWGEERPGDGADVAGPFDAKRRIATQVALHHAPLAEAADADQALAQRRGRHLHVRGSSARRGLG